MSGSVSFLVFRSGCSVQVQFGCETKFYAKVIIASLVLGMVRVKCKGEEERVRKENTYSRMMLRYSVVFSNP